MARAHVCSVSSPSSHQQDRRLFLKLHDLRQFFRTSRLMGQRKGASDWTGMRLIRCQTASAGGHHPVDFSNYPPPIKPLHHRRLTVRPPCFHFCACKDSRISREVSKKPAHCVCVCLFWTSSRSILVGYCLPLQRQHCNTQKKVCSTDKPCSLIASVLSLNLPHARLLKLAARAGDPRWTVLRRSAHANDTLTHSF